MLRLSRPLRCPTFCCCFPACMQQMEVTLWFSSSWVLVFRMRKWLEKEIMCNKYFRVNLLSILITWWNTQVHTTGGTLLGRVVKEVTLQLTSSPLSLSLIIQQFIYQKYSVTIGWSEHSGDLMHPKFPPHWQHWSGNIEGKFGWSQTLYFIT